MNKVQIISFCLTPTDSLFWAAHMVPNYVKASDYHAAVAPKHSNQNAACTT